MLENAKRLKPTPETLRELFLKSGNLCAFPGCNQLMMDIQGDFIGQLCHIEAAEEGGERFNASMTNDERRATANLMLMCYAHHVKTNDVNAYTVEVLRKFKSDHERRFSEPQRAILEKLTDWTTVDLPKAARNLKRMDRVLDWPTLTDEDLKVSVAELNAYVERLRLVPQRVRHFLGAVAQRAYRVRNTNAVQSSRIASRGTKILASDLEAALRLSPQVIMERVTELEAYSLGDLSEMSVGYSETEQPAVRVRDLKSGWAIWMDIAEFCERAHEPIDVFAVDLDFSRLDEP
jgi:hypothetical protein